MPPLVGRIDAMLNRSRCQPRKRKHTMSALTDVQVMLNGKPDPRIGFGTWLLKEGEECYRAVTDALQVGYRHIDTARAYYNEASVGRAVRDSGIPREELFITSKLPAEAKSYEAALDEFETTMNEIGLDYLDLYLVHAPWPWDEVGKDCRAENRIVWKAMEEFLASGRVRAIGVSNFTRADLDSLLSACTVVPMVDQIQWYVGLDVADNVAACAEHGMVVVLLTVRARTHRQPPRARRHRGRLRRFGPAVVHSVPVAEGCGGAAQSHLRHPYSPERRTRFRDQRRRPANHGRDA